MEQQRSEQDSSVGIKNCIRATRPTYFSILLHTFLVPVFPLTKRIKRQGLWLMLLELVVRPIYFLYCGYTICLIYKWTKSTHLKTWCRLRLHHIHIWSFARNKDTCISITKTCLFKYTENFTTKTWKFSDKKFWYFFYFCSKHRLWVAVRTASTRRF